MYYQEDELFHYGVGHLQGGHSGRYEWGSGDNPYQRYAGFMSSVNELKETGMSDTEIARALNMSSTEYRAKKSLAKSERRAYETNKALALKAKGYSNTKIGEMMGKNESSIRSLLDPVLAERNDLTQNTAQMLKDNVDSKGIIDIGAGVEREIGVSDTRLKTAVDMLKEDGYQVFYYKVEQAGNPGKYTTVKALATPDAKWKDAMNSDGSAEISTITDYMAEGGKEVKHFQYPESLSSDRIFIRYGDQGGSSKDGVIELRPGVEDISLGESNYAQVRVAVDGTHYLKGMAMYSSDIPKGYDVVYNTNKATGTPAEKVFKEMKTDSKGNIDKDNPFGATISADGQRTYIGEDGKEHLSVINMVRKEGEWSEWSRTLSSQFLSKQNKSLIEKQLNASYADKKDEFEEICELTNPAVKQTLLSSFADDCDSSAVHLKAAALPRQSTNVILPVPSLKADEIYAPNYTNGEKVALVRHPHGGIFEIPILTVNNNQKDAKEALGNAIDAVGINSTVAEQLSGADFDGDTVLVIPTHNRSGIKIDSAKPLEALKGFDTKSYKFTDEQLANGAKVISDSLKQTEMGKVSNLITDMTLEGASTDEIARAVKHSMVVIDSEKHKLDYQQSYVDNNIAELKKKYQGAVNGGAATLISRSKSETRIPERKENYTIDAKTGEKVYTETGREYFDSKTGKIVKAQEKSTKMAEASSAYELLSDNPNPKEIAYANYANNLKSLANKARKELLATENLKYSKAAKEAYSTEVESLNSKLNIALKNAPRERQAQLIANAKVKSKRNDNPDMTKDDIKKANTQALAQARAMVGASKQRVQITDKEWEAIQAGAISHNKLVQILNNSDLDEIKKLATPKQSTTLSSTKISRIKAYLNSGYTQKEIAQLMGISTSTVAKYAK